MLNIRYRLILSVDKIVFHKNMLLFNLFNIVYVLDMDESCIPV